VLSPRAIFLLGGVGGWVSAFGGAFKDAPIEGFHWLKFFRSPLLAGAWAVAVSQFTGDIVVIAFAALGYTVATTETYKTFFFPSRPRGKFQGKPILYPDLLRFRRRFVPLYAAIWLLILIVLFTALDLPAVRADGPKAQPATTDGGSGSVVVDMARGWVRHDGERCADPTRIAFAGGAISFDSHRSAAMVWQAPTLAGPLGIEPTLDWVRDCDRPPLSFLKEIVHGPAGEALLDLAEYPYLSWRWKVDGAIDDSAIARPDGRIRGEKNDFAAKVGVQVQTRGRDDAQEVAYVWSRSLPVGTVLYQQWSIPLVFKVQAQRVVVMSGVGQGNWVEEKRDVRADFERLFPGKQAGRVLRVYLMTDSDDTGGQVSAAYAGLQFERALASAPTTADLGASSVSARRAGR
jgi:hypothetical protein